MIFGTLSLGGWGGRATSKKIKTDELMSLSHEHVGLKILAKIKIYTPTRAELLFSLCYEIPCKSNKQNSVSKINQRCIQSILFVFWHFS